MNPTRLERLAARIGCTEGQLYSMVISLAAATVLILVSGVPLGDPPRATAAPVASAAPAPVVVPSPTPTPVLVPPAPPVLGQLPLPAAVPVGSAAPSPEVPDVAGPPTAEPAPPPSSAFSARVPAPGAPAALTSDATSASSN